MRRDALFLALLSVSALALAHPDGFTVDRTTQVKRDETRRAILEDELQSERTLLEEAQQQLSGAQARKAPETTIRELQDAARLHSANIGAIQRELAFARGGMLKVAAADGTNGPAAAAAGSRQTRTREGKGAALLELSGAKPSMTIKNPNRAVIRSQGNPRLVVFPYDRNNTYPIYLMEALNTHFEFPEGEQVKTLSVSNCGQDSPFWTCSISEDRRHIWIKPKAPDLTNVGTIVTNRRVYEISLQAVGAGRDWYQRVTWDGGWQDQGFFEFRDPLAQSKAPGATGASPDVQPNQAPGGFEKLRFAYVIEGDAPFRPLMVFDDGKFTWIKLGPNVQELPALFVLAGDEVELVNYTQRGDYLLVNRLVPGLLLKLGKAEVRIRNPGYTARR